MTRRTPAQYSWSRLEFDETILTKHFTSPRSLPIAFVVVHHMTIVGDGKGSALTGCYNTWQTREASAHYGVDGNYVRQFVWDRDAAWATANRTGNHAGISIEHANSTREPKWLVSDTTWKNGAKLAAHLHKVYKLGRPVKDKTLRKHSSFFATACPGPFLGGTNWSAYVKEAQRVYDEITGKATPAPPADPPPVVVPPPVVPVVSKPHEYISANLAGYDKVHGLATAAGRADTIIPDYLLPKAPEWFHFQECSAPMLDAIDQHFGKDYVRVPAGGKGRESLYRRDAGIKILEAELQNVAHMLDGDTKPHLTIAWEDADGFGGVYDNFHNENEGTTIQDDQLWDVMKHGVAMADKHGIPHANVIFTGDSNLLTARQFVKAKGWLEARDIAKKKIDLIYRTTNDWLNRLVEGSPIDVDVFHTQAVVDEAEMLFGVISDHFARRVIHRLTK